MGSHGSVTSVLYISGKYDYNKNQSGRICSGLFASALAPTHSGSHQHPPEEKEIRIQIQNSQGMGSGPLFEVYDPNL